MQELEHGRPESGWHKTLSGRVILITGGASGIGRATALMAAQDGATVIALDLDEALLAELDREAASRGWTLRTRVADVTDPASIRQAAQWCAASVGVVDGLVCSAGTTQEAPFLELPLELWSRILNLNLTGTFLVSQEIARGMVASGAHGSIVTLSSGLAIGARPGAAHYSASKAAVLALTKSMALELAPHHIRVNCVAPGSVDTPLARRVAAASGRTSSVSKHPLGRQGQPEDIAAMICFLLSESASWITGQTMHVNGGTPMV